MTTPKQTAFPVFELVVVLVLALIGWAAFRLYEIAPGMGENRKMIEDVRDEYARIGAFVPKAISDLDSLLYQFLKGDKPTDQRGGLVTSFETQSAEWTRWIQDERSRWSAVVAQSQVRPPAVRPGDASTNQVAKLQDQLLPLLKKLDTAFTNYEKAASYIFKNSGGPFIAEKLDARLTLTQRAKNQLMNQSRRAQMEAESLDLFLTGSQDQFGTLQSGFQHLRFALFCAIVGLCFMLVTLIYRHKVAESRAIIHAQRVHQKEQEANLEKLANFGELAQELAHEIKQPLTAINARLYTLQKALAAGSEPFKDAVVIRSEIKRLDEKVKDFLQLARPAEPKLVPLTADDAMRETRDLMARDFEGKSIKFQYECNGHIDFLGDPVQLKQVLINLLKNAAESLNGGGQVTLRARKEKRELRGQMREVAVLEVEDNGCGIPPEIERKIFDPFFSTKEDGTGLGLAIAARMIDKHKGSLEFETHPGQGTTFRIVLPALSNNCDS